jgi:hypothetical protein
LRNQLSFKDLSEIAHVEGKDGTGRQRERKTGRAARRESLIVKNI